MPVTRLTHRRRGPNPASRPRETTAPAAREVTGTPRRRPPKGEPRAPRLRAQAPTPPATLWPTRPGSGYWTESGSPPRRAGGWERLGAALAPALRLLVHHGIT